MRKPRLMSREKRNIWLEHMNHDRNENIRKRREEGVSLRKIAAEFGLSLTRIVQILAEKE